MATVSWDIFLNFFFLFYIFCLVSSTSGTHRIFPGYYNYITVNLYTTVINKNKTPLLNHQKIFWERSSPLKDLLNKCIFFKSIIHVGKRL